MRGRRRFRHEGVSREQLGFTTLLLRDVKNKAGSRPPTRTKRKLDGDTAGRAHKRHEKQFPREIRSKEELVSPPVVDEPPPQLPRIPDPVPGTFPVSATFPSSSSWLAVEGRLDPFLPADGPINSPIQLDSPFHSNNKTESLGGEVCEISADTSPLRSQATFPPFIPREELGETSPSTPSIHLNLYPAPGGSAVDLSTNEQYLGPRKIVKARFLDSTKTPREFTALFDPLSQVSFANRSMIESLGLRILPWKPVSDPPLQTLLGMLELENYAIVSAQTLEYGLPSPFPLHVAVLDEPFLVADFCFGRTAIQNMALQFKDFKQKLTSLCGYLADQIVTQEDDEEEEAASRVVDIEFSSSTQDQPGLTYPKPVMARKSHPSPALITPPQTHSANSEYRLVFEPTQDHLGPFVFNPSTGSGPLNLAWTDYPVSALPNTAPFQQELLGPHPGTMSPVDTFGVSMGVGIPPPVSVAYQHANDYSSLSGPVPAFLQGHPSEPTPENGEFEASQL